MYFSIIPQHVARNKKLGEARFLYGHILTLSNKVGYCYAPNEFLADIMECDARSITRYVKVLETARLVTLHYAKNSSRTIQPIDTYIGNKLLKNQNKTITMDVDTETQQALDTLWQGIK